MARNRKRRGKPEMSDDQPEHVNATAMAQAGAQASGASIGRTTPNHELSVMGASNLARFFDVTDFTNGPSCVIRQVRPFDGFIRGWSAQETDGISTGDYNAAIDVNSAVKDPLYPVTTAATHFSQSVWPVLENLFASGTGRRYEEVTQAEFVRYTAMLMDAYRRLRTVVTLNHLTYHYDWSKVYPFSQEPPTWLYDLAGDYECTDVGLASRWLPYMKRFDTKILFPRTIEMMQRMLTPMLSIDLNSRLLAPFGQILFTVNGANKLEDEVASRLDYVDGQMRDASALFQTFLPFPIERSGPWLMSDTPAPDWDRESAWWNSGLKLIDPFNDTGDPTARQTLIFIEDLLGIVSNVPWHTRHAQPIWAEMTMSEMYRENFGLDDTFELLTLHRWGNVEIPDDLGNVFVYDGTAEQQTAPQQFYEEYVTNRFYNDSLDFGKLRPGSMAAWITGDAVVRNVRLDVEYNWHLNLLKDVMVAMSGASIRELRQTIARAVYLEAGRPD